MIIIIIYASAGWTELLIYTTLIFLKTTFFAFQYLGLGSKYQKSGPSTPQSFSFKGATNLSSLTPPRIKNSEFRDHEV